MSDPVDTLHAYEEQAQKRVMRSFVVEIGTFPNVKNIPVLAHCSVDAIEAVRDRLPLDARVKAVAL